MSDKDAIDDAVPAADAAEQMRPATEPTDLESVDPDERIAVSDGEAPLESDPSDWAEQHQLVAEDDEEEFR